MGIGLTGFFEGCKPQFECGGVGNSFRVSGRNDSRVCKSRKIWTFVRYLDPTKTVDDYQKDKLFWKCFSLKFVHYIFSSRTRLVVRMICMKLVTFLESFVMFAENYNLLENELSNLMLDLFNGISKESS